MTRSRRQFAALASRLGVVELSLALILGGLISSARVTLGQPPPATQVTGLQVGANAQMFPSKTSMRGGALIGYHMVSTSDAVQFQGPIVNQRQPTYSTRSGFQIIVTANATSQFGYQPVVVTAKLQRPATSDRNVRFLFRGGSYYTAGKSITVEESLRVARGATSATTTLLIPQYQDWQQISWDVFVDGQEDDDLSVQYVTAFGTQGMNLSMTALVVSESPGLPNFQQALQMIGNGAAVRTRPPSELTDNWLHYTTLDVVAIDAAELSTLATKNPGALAAILRWTLAGGNLWVIEAGSAWDELPAVERELALRARGPRRGRQPDADDDGAALAEDEMPAMDADDADAAIEARGWTFVPLNERQLEPIEGALVLSGYDLGEAKPSASNENVAGTLAAVAAQLPTTSRLYFAVRPHGLGTIVAFRGDLPSDLGPNSITAVQRSLLAPRLSAASRLGNRPDSPNSEFNNWLIPGVGVAPVGQFQFLITIFVLAIGPLNYWWLKRQKRLPFLLATVPAAAAIVTLLLLVFGVLADGLGVRVRARSLTMLDQTAGQAATWSRLSYYAGLNPRRGLTMPADTAVYPVISDWAAGRYGRGPSAERELVWRDGQRLRRGWLPPRTPTQYVTVSAGPNQQRLELRKTAQGLQVRNRLNANVTHLMVQDHDGVVYWCEGLKAGEGLIVQPADERDVSTKMRRLFADNYPEFPAGADPTTYGGMAYSELLSKNLMETQIEAINSPVVRGWIDGCYIAVTDRGIDVDLGMEGADEDGSFHVVRGTW
jgi:hypothetical protein